MHNKIYDFRNWLYQSSSSPIGITKNEYNENLFNEINLDFDSEGNALHKDKSAILQYNMNDGNSTYNLKTESESMVPFRKKNKHTEGYFKALNKHEMNRGAMFNGLATFKTEMPWRTNKFESTLNGNTNGGVNMNGGAGITFVSGGSNDYEYNYNDEVNPIDMLRNSLSKVYDSLKMNTSIAKFASTQKPTDRMDDRDIHYAGYNSTASTPVGAFGDDTTFPQNSPQVIK